MQLTFRETVEALALLTDHLPEITGVDIWRRETNRTNFAKIDPNLKKERVRPPSKLRGAFIGNEDSV